MITNFKINFNKINGFVNLDKKFKDEIRKKILLYSPVYKFAEKVGITSVHLGYFLNNRDSLISIKYLIKILKALKISFRGAEKQIISYRDANGKIIYKIKFPYYFTPVDMRIIGVLIGDGNIHSNNKMLRWIQNDISPLKKLLFSKMNYNKINKKESKQFVIPAFFRKISCYFLNLKPSELGSHKLIQKSLDLPREYKLALLLAIIEDESNIDPRNYSGINIRMSDKDIINSLKELCNFLDYKTSKIIKYDNKDNTYGKNVMYRLNILSDGISKLGYNILDFEKKFGKNVSLWKKREDFFKRWYTCVGKRSKKNKDGQKIHKELINLFKRDKDLSLDEIAKKLKIKRVRLVDLLKRMCKRKEIYRIKRGLYKYKNDGVYVSKNLG